MTTVRATYEHGVLRLAEPPDLAEGSQVDVIVIAGQPAAKASSPADILAEIAAMPMGQGPEFSERDHDAILYGEPHGR